MANRVFLIAALSSLLALSRADEPSTNQRYQGPARGDNSNLSAHRPFPWFNQCEQQTARDLRSHPDNCNRFQMCSVGILISFSCPEGNVFHNESKSCVAKGSDFDLCSSSGKLICPPKDTSKKAHPKECAQYYHCGAPAKEARWEQHLKECEYPLLFNVATKRCEHFSMVTCGLRREPLDPCEYKSNECGSPHCVPCSVRFPSCRGKDDGMHGWEGREGSPHFVVCASQRVVYHGMCPQQLGVMIFDHDSRSCVMMNAKESNRQN